MEAEQSEVQAEQSEVKAEQSEVQDQQSEVQDQQSEVQVASIRNTMSQLHRSKKRAGSDLIAPEALRQRTLSVESVDEIESFLTSWRYQPCCIGSIRYFGDPCNLDAGVKSFFLTQDYTYRSFQESLGSFTILYRPLLLITFWKSQRIRWLFKRLASRFLYRKAIKRGVQDVNLLGFDEETMPKLEWIDYATRMVYRMPCVEMSRCFISALTNNSLMFPSPFTPRNPWTNVDFTLAQMSHLYSALLHYYVNHDRRIPSIVVKFREHSFNLVHFHLVERPDLVYHAVHAFVQNTKSAEVQMYIAEVITDHIAVSDVIQHIRIMRKIRDFLVIAPSDHAVVRKWKQFVIDSVQYVTSNRYMRREWGDGDDIRKSARRMWQESQSDVTQMLQSAPQLSVSAVARRLTFHVMGESDYDESDTDASDAERSGQSNSELNPPEPNSDEEAQAQADIEDATT